MGEIIDDAWIGKVVEIKRSLTPVGFPPREWQMTQHRELRALAMEKPDWLWYLASPYAHPTDWMLNLRFKAASRIGGLLWARYRIHTLGPIAHSHPLAVELAEYKEPNAPNSGTFWLPFDKPLQARCDGLMVAKLPDWRDSVGIAEETRNFRHMGKPKINLECRQWFTPEEWKLLGGTT